MPRPRKPEQAPEPKPLMEVLADEEPASEAAPVPPDNLAEQEAKSAREAEKANEKAAKAAEKEAAADEREERKIEHDASVPGHNKVLADNVHHKGTRYAAGTCVADLPEGLRNQVLRDETLAVDSE